MAPDSEFHSYFDHFEMSHRRLQRVVRETEELLKSVPSDMVVAQIWDHLQTLRNEMLQHFREEEEGGCLEEAACRCPNMTPRVNALIKEHQNLLESVNVLMAGITQNGELRVADVMTGFLDLAAKLRLHEAAEHEVLAQAFGLSLLADDNSI